MFLSNRKKTELFFIGVILALVFLAPTVIWAQTIELTNYGLDQAQGFGLGSNNLITTIGNIVRVVLGFLGIIAVLLILYAGFLWMTAAGDVSKIDKAKKIMLGAVIGLIIIFSSLAIASFIINQVSNATGANGNGDNGGGGGGFTPFNSSRYAYITGFRDNSLVSSARQKAAGDAGWELRLNWNFSGVANVPQSATLEAGGWAQDRGYTINSLEFLVADDGSDSWTASAFNNLPAEQESVSNVYAAWNTASEAVGQDFQNKIQAVGKEAFYSKVINSNILPIHCFNGVQDGDETQEDCGGSCLSCDGEACDSNTDTLICDPDDNLCRSGVCQQDSCTCAHLPILDYISPATDPLHNTDFNQRYQKQQIYGSDDFANIDTWMDDTANGAPGNYITLWGSYFGEAPGEVHFIGSDKVIHSISLDLSEVCGDDTWKTYQIIVAVPELPAGRYEVEVAAANGLISQEKVNFQINDIERPGICLANPDHGVYDATTVVQGIKFPYNNSEENKKLVWYFQPTNSTSTASGWTENQLTDIFPENRRGVSSIKVWNGGQYSNYYRMMLSVGGLGDPCGYDSRACELDQNTCNTGLVCNHSSCTCQPKPNVCGDGLLGSEEACDRVGNQIKFRGGYTDKVTCADYGLGAASQTITCTSACQLDTTACSSDYLSGPPATQSIYAWAFFVGNGNGLWAAPKVVEDCNRTPNCRPGEKLPSPTPWSEEWNPTKHRNLSIREPKACVDAIISARFTVPMDAGTFSGNIKVFKCNDQQGNGCAEIAGSIALDNDGSALDDNSELANDYFIFTPANLEINSWYKVVLLDDIKSYVNVSIDVDDGLVSDRNCNINGIDNAAYCWDFQTRETATLCREGCVECSPDPKTNYWLGQTTAHNANLDSEDNVCLMLNPQTRNWSWSSEDNGKVYVASGQIGYQANSTAAGENIGSTPPFTKVFAALASGQEDYCRVTNDFTNPIVVKDASCSGGTVQSPSPWILSQDACTNALIAARFSRNMVDSSIIKSGNIIVQKCTGEMSINEEDGSYNCDSWSDADVPMDNIHVFTYSHQVDYQKLLTDTDQATSTNFLADGFVIDVTAKDLENKKIKTGYLDSNTWYRVIIRGGVSGVRGAKVIGGSGGSEQMDGILVTPNMSFDYDDKDDSTADYYWLFKTGTGVCDINTVNVSPGFRFMPLAGQTQEYNALPQAANCNILARCLSNWNWQSKINLDDQSDNSGDAVAGITNYKNQTVCGGNGDETATSDGLVDPVQTATGKMEGETNIKAEEVATAKWGSGHLQIGYGDLRIASYEPQGQSLCTNAPIKLDFNLDAKKDSLVTVWQGANVFNNNIVKLYQCKDESCSLNEATPIDVMPWGDWINNQYIRAITAQPIRNNQPFNLTAGQTYRVVVKGGTSGPQAWNGKYLTGLNYNSQTGTSGVAGEACDPSVYPWSDQPTVCSASTCTLSGNLCNNPRFKECDNTAEGLETDYCDDTCHKLGNTNTASCGNKIVEASEECDDGNIKSGDGCSASCKFEGSNPLNGSLCGNGKIETGEQCDDGNTKAGDGCSSQCLKESGRKAGSEPNAPICGNSKIETGEQCDDGNVAGSDGCSASCLWEGSSSGTGQLCGNGKLDRGGVDSFSWTFSIADKATVCQAAEGNINNCENGIWRVKFSKDVKSADIKIQQVSGTNTGGCDTYTAAGFWSKLWAGIVGGVKKLFGLQATAANYWCDVFSDSYVIKGTGAIIDNYIDKSKTDFEVLGYQEADDGYTLNFLKQSNWTMGQEYRLVVDYALAGSGGTGEIKQATKIKEFCHIDDVVINVWPAGEAKTEDTFFCSDDNCGAGSNDKYLQDQNSGTAGNQHLYRAWALSQTKLVNADRGTTTFAWSLGNQIPYNFRNFSISDLDSNYSGDKWVTLKGADDDVKANGGSVTLEAKAGATGVNKEQVLINIFLCNNPWPSAQYFPFIDSANNCTSGSGNCPNTNFKLFYCRDREAGDLPAIGINENNQPKVVVTGSNSGITKEFLFVNNDTNDAIGLRVMTNDNHFSPLKWYRATFPENQGASFKSLQVDNYQAIQEGRTVYVSAADLNENLTSIFSDVYLLSYNEKAASTTLAIYNQLLNHFIFNVGASNVGGLYASAGHCSEQDSFSCFTDNDCQRQNAGYCQSAKAKLTRDVSRLADLQDIQTLLTAYHDRLGYYPDLGSGTYITGRSLSVWPSWQATLGNALSSALPVDPLNKLTGCGGEGYAGYDAVTCWNETNKEMQAPSLSAYIYYYQDNKLYTFGEYDNGNGAKWEPANWSAVQGLNYNPFKIQNDKSALPSR